LRDLIDDYEGNPTGHRKPILLCDKRVVDMPAIVGYNARALVENLDERLVGDWCCLLEFIPNIKSVGEV
jgi:hypothetical protein